MYESGYNRLFWGMLFIIFDINIGAINILPNFIGYLFILSGLSILISQHKNFEKGKVPGILLTLLTLKDIYHNPQNNILAGEFHNLSLYTLIIGSVVTVLNLYLIYIICKTIYELCEERGLSCLKNNTKHYWMLYFVVTVLFLLYTPLSINLPSGYNVIMIIVSILQLVSAFWIAWMFRRCKVELRE